MFSYIFRVIFLYQKQQEITMGHAYIFLLTILLLSFAIVTYMS